MRIEEVLDQIIELCRKHSASRVILFGSRAKGTAGERSDIDIAVSGAVDFDGLAEEIGSLPTLYTIDLVILQECGSDVLSGTSAKFSITFDLAWKVMKDILVQHYAIIGFVSGSPREVLKESYRAQLISDDRWLEMLKVRNQLAHDYDGLIVRKYCGAIVEEYVDLFFDFRAVVERLAAEKNKEE